ncbi:MAG: isochorismatase family protein [Thermoplasmata archaeon]|nr:isochorismatase family protein [Thermoplasmata archaeon]
MSRPMQKEHYLTEENEEEKVSNWLQVVKEFRGRKENKSQPINLENAMLLVIDMQKYFTHPVSHAFVPSSEIVIRNINKLIEGLEVRFIAYTKHIDERNSRMLRWWGKGLFGDNPLSEIDARIKVAGPVLTKSTYSAFYRTELEHLLEKHRIEKVVVTGLLTNLCCETTAREAFVQGYEVFFVVDATATYNEQLHLATLLNLSHGFARIVGTKEIVGGEA